LSNARRINRCVFKVAKDCNLVQRQSFSSPFVSIDTGANFHYNQFSFFEFETFISDSKNRMGIGDELPGKLGGMVV
jgi:hypothetical protein